MNDTDERIIRRPAVIVGRSLSTILVAVAIVTLAFRPDAWSGEAEGCIAPSTAVPAYEKLAAGPWHNRPVQGKQFWFTLGGGDESPGHIATLKQRPIADAGLASYGVAEWGYSFHHLNLAASRGAERVRLLLKASADVNWADADGGTALMSAAASGDEEAVRLLLDAGANPNAEDRKGRTAYWYALNYNNEGAAEILAPLTADHRSSESSLRQSFH